MPENTDLSIVLAELSQTRVAMVDAVKKMRHRNIAFAIFSVMSVVLCAIYLGYAAERFGHDVTPDLVAANVQTSFESSLPKVRASLAKNLQDNAPKFVGDAFDQLQVMPQKYTDDMQVDASAKMDSALPQVQESLYASMKDAVDQSIKAAPPGAGLDDQARMNSTLAAVGSVYAAETIKFVNQVHAEYSAEAVAFTDYLNTLGENQNLDHKDQLYREMFRTAFALVRDHENNPGPGSPVDLTILKPVQ